MMHRDCRIRVVIKTIRGFETICEYYLGGNYDTALSVFLQLEGNDGAGESDVLQVDLIDMQQGLPLNLRIKHCTLSQMSNNCRILTREIFKQRNLVG